METGAFIIEDLAIYVGVVEGKSRSKHYARGETISAKTDHPNASIFRKRFQKLRQLLKFLRFNMITT